MWHDNETDRDFLNFTGVADTVAEIIRQANGEPVSIGVSGAWGVGKSSMLKLIKQALNQNQRPDGKKFVFVDFNAWLYQGYDDARAALIDVISNTLKEEAEKIDDPKLKELILAQILDIIQRLDWIRATKIAAGIAGVLTFGPQALGFMGIASGFFDRFKNAKPEAFEELQKTAGELGKTATGLLKPKVESSPPKEIEAIRKQFTDTLNKLNITLIVLIDDLDRCLPTTTISTLEAIRLFLFLDHTAFVIAADTAVIKHAVKKHFIDVDDAIATNYFDKLIQIPIGVPPLGNQEVRAYLLLLFIENSSIDKDKKDEIRRKVCEQLRLTWKGHRVDRAFMESLSDGLPVELVADFDTAERLAPIMTKANQIAGNPRLIKRFLNSLAIRMAISDAHGVGVDESALVKMLLFERCGNDDVYKELTTAVNADPEGKPHFLATFEESALTNTAIDHPYWGKDEFAIEWLALPPKLADQDLRGILYVSREHAPLMTPEERLSSEGLEILDALLQQPGEATALHERISKLQGSDSQIIMGKLLSAALQIQEWGTPPILTACMTVATADLSQGQRLSSFLLGRPLEQIQPDIVPMLVDKPWGKDVLDSWKQSSVSRDVKNAIQEY
ncbi:MAG: KAP family P-loop NTPase fold protein [Armatimonadota bacterium]